eukprot:293811-Chlamydomonas_euryale.AAC.3
MQLAALHLACHVPNEEPMLAAMHVKLGAWGQYSGRPLIRRVHASAVKLVGWMAEPQHSKYQEETTFLPAHLSSCISCAGAGKQQNC